MLPKLNRLQKTRDFDRVFKNSRPVSTEHLSLRVAKNRSRDGNNRFGFVISNKIDKRATRRNALKRQLREISRSLILELQTGYDVVVLVRRDFNFPYKQEEIKKEIVEGLQKSEIFENPNNKFQITNKNPNAK